MSDSERIAGLRARYVFPVSSAPLEDAVVCFAEGRLTAVERYSPAARARGPIVDLGNAAILPGLVNAHTHLEFSHLSEPLGSPGMVFPDWIRRVVAHRQAGETERRESVEQGLRESLQSGTTTLGEIATSPWSAEAFFEQTPLDATVFLELIGLSAERVEEKLAEARGHLATAAGEPKWHVGISPHAPYSVHPELFSKAVDEARRTGAPVAFHLAESREELQLLRDGRGPFRELLIDLGAWDESAIPRGTRPLDYLRQLAHAPKGLVIHGNYLDDEEIALLAAHSDTLSLVYCPRTHAYFDHDAYPLARLMASGVSLALGTDSRASNPDLSLFEEMRHVARRGDILPADVLRLGTLNGANALGRGHEMGSLCPDKRADLCVMKLPDDDASDPHELLLHDDTSPAAIYVSGRQHDVTRCGAV